MLEAGSGFPLDPFVRCRCEKHFEGEIKKPSCAPSKSLTARPAARRRGEPGKAGSMWLFNVHSEDNGNGSAHSQDVPHNNDDYVCNDTDVQDGNDICIENMICIDNEQNLGSPAPRIGCGTGICTPCTSDPEHQVEY